MNTKVKVDGAAGPIEIDDSEVKHTPVGAEMKDWLNKFHDIEEKNKCLRVQFLDWLSDKLLDWSNSLHVMSVKIDSPCIIKVEPRKKEDSQDAKDRAEISRLKELLAKYEARTEYRVKEEVK
jgi:hypothetical protein